MEECKTSLFNTESLVRFGTIQYGISHPIAVVFSKRFFTWGVQISLQSQSDVWPTTIILMGFMLLGLSVSYPIKRFSIRF